MAYSTIPKPSLYFNTKLYTGDGGTQSVTGVGFQPDWTWIKNRGSTDSHNVYDAVRGVTKYLLTNNNVAEGTTSGVTAFNSDGFSVGNNSMTNSSSNNYASWNWKAGTTASGATTGSGTAKTYSSSSNSTAGFSIVTYTGNGTAGHTVPHGCGSAPTMVIFKQLNASRGWGVYHKDLGITKIIYLDENILPQTASPNTQFLNNTAPSSSVVSLGTWSEVNTNDASYVAYCFAEKKGYSKSGSYTGNGNDDGTFVYTGFKPAFVMVKIIDGQTDNWIMQDDKINSFNGASSQRLRPNSSGAEFSSSNEIDYLSNGFKTHGNDGEINGSGFSYIYMAFAEEPLVANVGNSIPATAR